MDATVSVTTRDNVKGVSTSGGCSESKLLELKSDFFSQ